MNAGDKPGAAGANAAATEAGGSVSVIGHPDVAHSWTAVDDVATAPATLGTDERSWGRAWPVPTPALLTRRQLIDRFCEAAGRDGVKVKRLPRVALRLVGLASPTVRELLEVTYQFEEPFVVDSSAVTAAFGIEPAPITETIARAVESRRDQSRSEQPSRS